jgi:iron-sulfur cluster insertion protein
MINVTSLAAEKIHELLSEENKPEEGEGATDADQTIESNGIRLFVDPISVRYLKGAEVDFVDNLAGGGFTIRNPNAKSTCGCGSSFSV